VRGDRKGCARSLCHVALHPNEFKPQPPKLPSRLAPCAPSRTRALLHAEREIHEAKRYTFALRQARGGARTAAAAWRCSAAFHGREGPRRNELRDAAQSE
jgi:hypothetical protein